MEDPNQLTRNRMVLLSIVGIPVTVILVATWLWYFVERGDLDLVGVLGTANRGTLVQPPRQLDEQDLLDGKARLFTYAELEPKWAMLVPGSGARCDEACEKSLYLTRQIHVALGKDFNRLRRLYISETEAGKVEWAVPQLSDQRPAPASFTDYLANDHRGLKALTLATGSYAVLFNEHKADASTWYLVDPRGWIMMSYNNQVPYKDVISDLKFLLKNSSD
jgi:hypothetical protein